MVEEVVAELRVGAGDDVLDATVGAGGHARALLSATGPDGRLLGLDADPAAIPRATAALAEFGDRSVLVHSTYDQLPRVAPRHGFTAFAGVLMDLGISSHQLADPQRGFSFSAPGPLDMRLDPAAETTAADLVNELPAQELAALLRDYGDEPRARRIARGIVAARPLESTTQLAAVVARAAGYRRGRTHPATRTFQALRIAVNDELGMLQRALPMVVDHLAAEGRLAVISFHSLEDRIVKQAFRTSATDCICPPEVPECRCAHRRTVRLVTKRPLRPAGNEVRANPRSRSARMRVLESLPPAGDSPTRGDA